MRRRLRWVRGRGDRVKEGGDGGRPRGDVGRWGGRKKSSAGRVIAGVSGVGQGLKRRARIAMQIACTFHAYFMHIQYAWNALRIGGADRQKATVPKAIWSRRKVAPTALMAQPKVRTRASQPKPSRSMPRTRGLSMLKAQRQIETRIQAV
jgi:hypothetical protein